MVPPPSPAAPGRIRRILRRYRSILLLPVLFILAFVVYLNQVGLPNFVKRPLVRELHERGLKLEFDRLRLLWDRGLVGERVVLAEARDDEGPQFVFDEVVLEPDWGKLARFTFELRSLRLRNGTLAVPLDLVDPNAPPFRINALQAELKFLPDDRWELAGFTAEGLGLNLQASGSLTNASAVRDWTGGPGPRDRAESLAAWRAHLRRATAYARYWRFGRPPRLSLTVAGDARDPASIRADLRLEAESIESQWGTLQSLNLRSALNRPTEFPGVGRSEVTVDFRHAHTAWGGIQHGHWELRWTQAFTNLLPSEVQWQLGLERVESPWGEIPHVRCDLRAYPHAEVPGQLIGELSATSDAIFGGLARAETNRLTATVRLDPVTYLPSSGEYHFTATNVQLEDGTARGIELQGDMKVREAESKMTVDSGWAWWAALEPFALTFKGGVHELILRGVEFDAIELDADWRAPQLRLNHLQVDRAGEQLTLRGDVDVATRQAAATARMNLDVHALESLLTPKTVRWLSQYAWDQPPRVEASAEFTLPEWGQTAPDWRGDVQPTLRLRGHVEAGPASYRGIQADTVNLEFSYSNRVWHLPQLVASRPEGTLEFAYTEDTTTRDYHFHVISRIDPGALRPLLDPKAQKAFDLFDFTAPPLVTGDVRGRWRAHERIGVQAQLELTRLVFRGEPIDELSATLEFTNLFLNATGVHLRSGDESVIAPGVGFDLADQWLYLTNVTARVDPLKVGRAIGPKTAQILSPYHFLEPPRARVDGSINVRQSRLANLRFEVDGGPFHYWRFQLPEIAGTVHWTNETVSIRELNAPFYQGRLEGQFRVDVGQSNTTPFQFEARVARADFHELLSDLHSPTNRVEGQLSVDLAITRADARDWQSWQGFGQAELLDGFLWDIPMVGIFSPVLNSILPGVGKSRISGATATFRLTNSIVFTDDLELRAPFFRLAYRGKADFDGRLNARVEARLLRDAWVIGPLVSLIFSPLTKILEYEVTGTLGDPRLEPIYIPKPFQAPLDPLGTLREMFRQPPSQIPPPNP